MLADNVEAKANSVERRALNIIGAMKKFKDYSQYESSSDEEEAFVQEVINLLEGRSQNYTLQQLGYYYLIDQGEYDKARSVFQRDTDKPSYDFDYDLGFTEEMAGNTTIAIAYYMKIRPVCKTVMNRLVPLIILSKDIETYTKLVNILSNCNLIGYSRRNAWESFLSCMIELDEDKNKITKLFDKYFSMFGFEHIPKSYGLFLKKYSQIDLVDKIILMPSLMNQTSYQREYIQMQYHILHRDRDKAYEIYRTLEERVEMEDFEKEYMHV